MRIIAATNRELKKMVGRGEFREVLYFRLNVIELEIAPRRQCREDIPALVDFFLAQYKSDDVFTKDAHPQPGPDQGG